ncbi:MAG: hypothetical protein AMXMBFR82_06440 [Candidatus Hydrogenedentota bacterium]
MLFLIQYDTHHGTVIRIQEFEDAQRRKAEKSRAALELALQYEGADYEVALLDARELDDLRKTHPHYFKDAPESVRAAIDRHDNP